MKSRRQGLRIVLELGCHVTLRCLWVNLDSRSKHRFSPGLFSVAQARSNAGSTPCVLDSRPGKASELACCKGGVSEVEGRGIVHSQQAALRRVRKESTCEGCWLLLTRNKMGGVAPQQQSEARGRLQVSGRVWVSMLVHPVLRTRRGLSSEGKVGMGVS